MTPEKDPIITIRLAKPKEASAVSDLLYQSFDEYKLLYTEKAFAATTPGIHEIESRINRSFIWIALYNDLIAGTISLITTRDRMMIKSVAVAPIARRRGIGKALLRHAEKMAISKRVKYLELTTTHFLREAICLYEFFGFKRHGYDDLLGTPLIRMIKFLNQIQVLSEEAIR